jgi:DNA-binding CsgD family transcriptional regulator
MNRPPDFSLALAAMELTAAGFDMHSTAAGAAVLAAAAEVDIPVWQEYSPRPDLLSMTGRELDVMRLTALGITRPMISRRLHTSESTVRDEQFAARDHLNAIDRQHMVRRGIEAGLIRPEMPETGDRSLLDVDGLLSISLGSRGWTNEQLAAFYSSSKAAKVARVAGLTALGYRQLEPATAVAFGERIFTSDDALYTRIRRRGLPA